MRSKLILGTFGAAISALVFAAAWKGQPSSDVEATEAYLRSFSPAAIIHRGTDYASPRYRPQRLGKPLEKIDIDHDYDFTAVADLEEKLEGVNRESVLRALFRRLTRSAHSDTERHLAVLSFLQKASVHNPYVQPMHPNGAMVEDPLVLLELNEMRCAHVAVVAVEIFDAAGYEGRLVQLGGHVIAEIRYDNAWHYFDADVFDGGQVVQDENGRIPSVAELSRARFLLDSQASDFETQLHTWTGKRLRGPGVYPSYFYFSQRAYENYQPGYSVKRSEQGSDAKGRVLWDRVEPAGSEKILLYDFGPKYQPSAVTFASVVADESGSFEISWAPSEDPDGDLLGYRVFVGSISRDWHFNYFTGSQKVARFWTGGWRPEMYDRMFELPPSDVALVETAETSVTIRADKPVYVTVAPFDAHGEAVGKRLYFMSEELRLDGD